jgi:hypothetical protein
MQFLKSKEQILAQFSDKGRKTYEQVKLSAKHNT